MRKCETFSLLRLLKIFEYTSYMVFYLRHVWVDFVHVWLTIYCFNYKINFHIHLFMFIFVCSFYLLLCPHSFVSSLKILLKSLWASLTYDSTFSFFWLWLIWSHIDCYDFYLIVSLQIFFLAYNTAYCILFCEWYLLIDLRLFDTNKS